MSQQEDKDRVYLILLIGLLAAYLGYNIGLADRQDYLKQQNNNAVIDYSVRERSP